MTPPPSRFRFGPFVVERPAYRALRDGQALALSPKLVDVLLYFASRPSMLVTKDELFNAIWPDVTVTENALTRAISDLRQALGDEPASPKYIQTSNLDAFRAASEARVKLDSLDPAQVAVAVEGFERAVRLDPRYALAYAGLANAHYLLYEATRARNAPDAGRLATAIGHARRCVDLDDTLAEGHATLAFLLVSAGRFTEAVAAGRRAVALEPHDWRHLFRLGHAAWGGERLDALKRALAYVGSDSTLTPRYWT
jgi:tetratricopeptide (TPR) repeat protein